MTVKKNQRKEMEVDEIVEEGEEAKLSEEKESEGLLFENETREEVAKREVIPEEDDFPLCIVWCPLPLLTWIIPFIGHLGIANSEGIINDFVGPYTINVKKKEDFKIPISFLI